MTKLLTAPILILVFLSACSPAGNDAPQKSEEQAVMAEPAVVADTVYTNGRIYTVDEARPWAEAVAIKDGKFLVVGSNADVEAVTGDGTEVIDLAGGFAMPGIGDTHIHPASVCSGNIDTRVSRPAYSRPPGFYRG